MENVEASKVETVLGEKRSSFVEYRPRPGRLRPQDGELAGRRGVGGRPNALNPAHPRCGSSQGNGCVTSD